MTIYEIIGGIILLIAAIAIIFLTLAQQNRGKGLSGAITGGNGMDADNYVSPAERMLGKLTKIIGAIFLVGAIVACVLSSRLG